MDKEFEYIPNIVIRIVHQRELIKVTKEVAGILNYEELAKIMSIYDKAAERGIK